MEIEFEGYKITLIVFDYYQRKDLVEENALAQFTSQTLIDKYGKVDEGYLGTLFIPKYETVGVGVICHEMIHCAFEFIRRMGVNNFEPNGGYASENEEKCCYIIGGLHAQVIKTLWNIGYYNNSI